MIPGGTVFSCLIFIPKAQVALRADNRAGQEPRWAMTGDGGERPQVWKGGVASHGGGRAGGVAVTGQGWWRRKRTWGRRRSRWKKIMGCDKL
jgi:hypothetical protein